MQRYFENFTENIFYLNEDDSRHHTKVMRKSLDEKLEIVSFGKLYLVKVIGLGKRLKLELIKELMLNEKLEDLTLVQALLTDQKFSLVIQKATELGVTRIIPLITKRSVAKVREIDKKLLRWEKIAKEASEQSKRLTVPIISPPMEIEQLNKLNANLKLYCSLNENSESLKKYLVNYQKGGKIIIVIGPEGGFTKEEEKKLSENFKASSLGNLVLRTETASLYVLSAINYVLMRE